MALNKIVQVKLSDAELIHATRKVVETNSESLSEYIRKLVSESCSSDLLIMLFEIRKKLRRLRNEI